MCELGGEGGSMQLRFAMLLIWLWSSSLGTAPSSMCCQYAHANAGLSYPLRLILEGKLPQVCGGCSILNFGENSSSVGSRSSSRNQDRSVEQQHGFAAVATRSVNFRGKRGRRPRSIFVASAGSERAGKYDVSEDPRGDTGGAASKKSSKRIEGAMYAASLKEAIRPLVRADISSQDPTLQAMVLSQIPLECLAVNPATRTATNSSSMQSTIEVLCGWFRARTAPRLSGSSAARSSQINHVAHEIKGKFKDEASIATAFAAALRGQSIRCRVVHDVSEDVIAASNKTCCNRTGSARWWAEVWSREERRWMPVDPIGRCQVDFYHEPATTALGWNSGCSHVIAGEDGVVSDVTRRYVRLWDNVQALRPVGGDSIVQDILMEASQKKTDPQDDTFCAEQHQFRLLGAQEELPRSVSALRRHPLFVLERLLIDREILGEGAQPVATIVIDGKAEQVYSRQHVHRLCTRDEWRGLLKVVKRGEEPVRRIREKCKQNARSASLSRMARLQRQEASELFGQWQTETLDVGKVNGDGRVPTNQHGYVELLTKHHLPEGCAHIDHEAAALVARGMKIDYAPAMVGKIAKNGFDRPLFQGVIVRQEFESKIREGCLRRDSRKGSTSDHLQAGSYEKTLADFRRLILQVLGRLVALRGDSARPDGEEIEGIESIETILKELESQLISLKSQEDNSDSHTIVRSDAVSVIGLPEQIRRVMFIVKEASSDPKRAMRTITALGLAVSRLHIVLGLP